MSQLLKNSGVLTRNMSKNLATVGCTIPSKKQQGKIQLDIKKEELKIVDIPKKNLLVMKLGSYDAEVEYEKAGNTYDLVFSRIPMNLQGQGYGKILAEKAFDYLVERNKKMKLTCEFLQHFYDLNKAKYEPHIVS